MTDTPNDEGGSDQGPTLDDWRELAAKDLKGRDPESLTWHFEDEVGELAIQPFEPVRVPDFVDAIVAAGGRIHEVDAGRRSLEERFLALLARGANDRGPAA